MSLSSTQKNDLSTSPSTEVLQLIYEQIGVCIFIIDPTNSGQIISLNRHARLLLNYPPDDLITLKFPDIIIDKTLAEAILKCTEPFSIDDASLWCHHGQTASVQMDIQPTTEGQLVCMAKDITRQKQQAKELRLKNNILDHTLCGLDIISQEGKILYANQAYLNMWGYRSMEEVYGMSPSNHCQDPTIPQKIISNLKVHGEHLIEFTAIRKDKSTFDAHMLTQRFVDESDAEVYIGSSIDISERRKIEFALRESENRYRTIFEQAAVGMAIVDRTGTFIRVNQRLLDITGYSREQLEGKSARDITHPDDLPRDFAQRKKLLSGTISSFSVEKRIILQDSTLKWVKLTVGPQRNIEHGEIEYLISATEDIQQQKETEVALTQERQRLKLAMDAGHMGTWQWDISSQKVVANAGTARLLGLGNKALELNVEHVVKIFHPEDRPHIALAFERHVVYEKDFRVVFPDNQIHWRRSVGQPYYNEKQKFLGFYGIIIDVDTYKKAEEELRRRQKFITTILDNSPDCVKVLSPDGNLISINEMGVKLLEIDNKADILGLSYSSFFPEEEQKKANQAMQEAHRGRKSQFRCFCPTAKGKLRWWDIIITPIYNHKKLDQILAVSRDVTNAWHAEAKLIESESRFRALIDVSSQIVWTADADGEITEDSPTWRAFTGQSTSEWQNYGWLNVFHPEDRDKLMADWLGAVQNKTHFQTESRICNSQGEYRWMLIRAVPRYKEGKISGWVGMNSDITERKNYEKKINDLNISLEEKVEQRTRQLIQANEELSSYAEEMEVANEDMQAAIEELQTANESITSINEKLAYTSRILQEAQTAAKLGNWEVDIAQNPSVVYWAHEIYHIHGIAPRAHMLHEEAVSFILEEDRLAFLDLIDVLLTRKIPYSTVFRIRRANEEIRFLHIKGFPVVSNQGELLKTWGIIQDITEQKIMNEELVRTTNLLKEAEARAHLGHFEVDYTENNTPDIYLSDEMNRILGLVPGVQISLDELKKYFPKSDWVRISRFQHAFSKNKQKTYETVLQFTRKDGKTVYLETKGFPVFNHQQQLIKFRGISQDITHRILMEKELQEANELLEQRVKRRTAKLQTLADTLRNKNDELLKINTDLDNFVYMSSHDLKHPVTNLEGLMSVFDYYKNTEDELAEWLVMMNNSLARLKNTIAQITEISKIQKEVEEEVETLDFYSVTQEVMQDINQLIQSNRATIHTNFRVSSIAYIQRYLRSILQNLISNAIKYRHKDRDPVVEVSTYQHQNSIVLAVKDNGLGLTKEEQGKLFKMFKRMHVHVEGSGVGLYMIRRMLQNYGGDIQVNSVPEKGSTFTVYFHQV